MSAPDGFVSLTATRIQDASGALLAAGTLEVLPTDGNNVPITAAAGGVGGPILTTAAILTVAAGILQTDASIADTTRTLPANISYRLTTKDPQGRTISTLKGVQTVAGTALNLDTYQPNVGTLALIVAGPPGPPGPMGGVTGASSVVLVDTVDGTSWSFSIAGGAPVYTQL